MAGSMAIGGYGMMGGYGMYGNTGAVGSAIQGNAQAGSANAQDRAQSAGKAEKTAQPRTIRSKQGIDPHPVNARHANHANIRMVPMRATFRSRHRDTSLLRHLPELSARTSSNM